MKEYSQCKGAGILKPWPYTIIYKGCMIHTFRASMLAVCIAFMLTRVVESVQKSVAHLKYNVDNQWG